MSILQSERREISYHSTEHYRRHQKQLIKNSMIKKEHVDSTKENIQKVMKKWTQYETNLYQSTDNGI